MKTIFSKDNLFSILISFIPSALFKVESLWSLLLLIFGKNTNMNTFRIIDIFELIAFVTIFSFIITYIKKLKRKNEYLTKIVFLRTSLKYIPPSDFKSKYENQIEIDPFKNNFDQKRKIAENEILTFKRLLDYERSLLISDFNEFYKDSLTKKQLEKEITELYNEPFGYFR